jgi:hypothetical protein
MQPSAYSLSAKPALTQVSGAPELFASEVHPSEKFPRPHYSEVFICYALAIDGRCVVGVSGRSDDHSAIISRIASMFHKIGAVDVGLIRNQ